MPVYNFDCILGMRFMLPDNSVDAIVTDPPYELGFMGKAWDGSGVAFNPEVWREALRVLKPGGHLLAFGGSRTYHRMACAIEDAGFEIRDQIMWVYGSGFPKSKNVGDGWGTALKPAHEPICVARKPLAEKNVAANVLAHGTGAINIDGCRVPHDDTLRAGSGGMPRHEESVPRGRVGEASAGRRYAENGGTNFAATPGPRGGDIAGRWPANLIHDGSDEVRSAFPDAGGQQGALTGNEPTAAGFSGGTLGDFTGDRRSSEPRREDDKSAARFFYCAKASKADRSEANIHPTVKPTELMRYLVRLVTPPGGHVVDIFAGSGSTGKAAKLEGFQFTGFELSPEYVAIANGRIEAA